MNKDAGVRELGDAQAIRRGRVGERLVRRGLGKLSSRLIGAIVKGPRR